MQGSLGTGLPSGAIDGPDAEGCPAADDGLDAQLMYGHTQRAHPMRHHKLYPMHEAHPVMHEAHPVSRENHDAN